MTTPTPWQQYINSRLTRLHHHSKCVPPWQGCVGLKQGILLQKTTKLFKTVSDRIGGNYWEYACTYCTSQFPTHVQAWICEQEQVTNNPYRFNLLYFKTIIQCNVCWVKSKMEKSWWFSYIGWICFWLSFCCDWMTGLWEQQKKQPPAMCSLSR